MARIRTVKPEFFTSEDIVSLSPFARLLYIALWCEADREGRMSWKPKTFKMRYLPADSENIDLLCNELTEAGLVVLYGNGYAYIPSFHAHQHINPREAASQLPAPESGLSAPTRKPRVIDASPTRESRDSDVQVGRERKGREVSIDALFDKFWGAYPKKVGKDAALKAFEKRKPNVELLDEMLQAIDEQKTSDAWTKDCGQFIPNPATWLNQGRWMDEVVATGRSFGVSSIFAGAI